MITAFRYCGERGCDSEGSTKTVSVMPEEPHRKEPVPCVSDIKPTGWFLHTFSNILL